jgi:hypothetical protein
MTMAERPQDFERIQKLLALKRHEQPPSIYFYDFSDRVVAQLHTLDSAPPLSWWQRLGLDFDPKLALVCALGVAISGLLLAGMLTSMQLAETSVAEFRPFNDNPMDPVEPVVLSPPGSPLVVAGLNLTPIARPEEVPASTAPVMSAVSASSPFNQLGVQARKVGFTFGGSGK